MRISDIFYSLQGEGLFAGQPSVFIRLAGCPLRCRWCDTAYAQNALDAEDYTMQKVLQTVSNWSCGSVVITGGEPMISPDMPELAKELKACNKHITIETAGIVSVTGLACDLMSISPKLSNSKPAGEREPYTDISALRSLAKSYHCQFKFVIDSENDIAEVQSIVGMLGGIAVQRVFLMPQAKTRDEFLAKATIVADLCKQSGFSFGQRLHILLWDGQRGI